MKISVKSIGDETMRRAAQEKLVRLHQHRVTSVWCGWVVLDLFVLDLLLGSFFRSRGGP